MPKLQRAAGMARIEEHRHARPGGCQTTRHIEMRKCWQANDDDIGSVDRGAQIARDELRPCNPAAQHTFESDAALLAKWRKRVRRATPEPDFVPGGHKLRDGGGTTGTASCHRDPDHCRSVFAVL